MAPSPALTNTALADRSAHCAAGQTADFASILTISPPIPAGGMRVGDVVHLTLVYLPPVSCQVTARATPQAPQAKDSDVNIDWTVANCARAVANLDGRVLADERIAGIDPPYGNLTGQFQVKVPSPASKIQFCGIDLLGRVGSTYGLTIGSNPPPAPNAPPPLGSCPGGAQNRRA